MSVGAVSYSINPLLPLTSDCVDVREVVSVSESQTNVVYKVDDHTGPLVDIKKWLEDQEPEAELNLKADKLQVRVCVYVCSLCKMEGTT